LLLIILRTAVCLVVPCDVDMIQTWLVSQLNSSSDSDMLAGLGMINFLDRGSSTGALRTWSLGVELDVLVVG
jgi:hypothetical protein